MNKRYITDPPARPNVCQYLLSIRKWRGLTDFSMKNLLSIYNYLLKKWITIGIFDISSFSMV